MMPASLTGSFVRSVMSRIGIAVDALDVLLVGPNGRRNEENPFALVLMLDPAQILLCCGAP